MNPWTILGGLLVAAGLVTTGYIKGRHDVQAAWTASELTHSEKEKTLILNNETKIETIQRMQNETDRRVAEEYQRRLILLGQIDTLTKSSNVAAVRLRDPGTLRSCPSLPSSSSSPLNNDATPTGNGLLSEEAARFLQSEALQADQLVEQLRLSQQWAIGSGLYGQPLSNP